MLAPIPIHDFSKDDDTSIPFRYVPIDSRSAYDTTLPHRHNYYEILFFKKGGGTHTIDFKTLPVNDNSIHFVSPGQVHQLQRSDGSAGSLLIFSRDSYHLRANAQNSLFNYPFLNNNLFSAISITEQEEEEFKMILLQVAAEYQHEARSYAIMHAYLEIILLKCMRIFELQHPAWKHVTRGTFYNFRLLVEQEYRLHKLPSYYAGQLNITERQLNEVCKDATGHNVSAYMKARVILEAKRLLYNSDGRINEIADFLGFEDPSYFNRFFKANTGITAGDFRKKQIVP